MKRPGFTLIEIVIVFAIIAILLIISMMSWRRQLDKARDAQRKEHLQRLSVAFEDYYNDHECYPLPGTLSGPSDGLKPYLDKIPRDPITKQPYYLEHSDCVSYRILTRLNNDSDPVINGLNCNPNCGFPDDPEANYGISSTNIPVSNNPSTGAKTYYCQSSGNCTEISPGQTCNPVYPDSNCTGSNGCAIISICD